MITVTISKHKDQYKGFELKGHAGYADSGSDIVCAAVSILVINTYNSIENFTDDAFKGESSEDGGYLAIHFSEDNSKELKLLVDSMVLGLEQVEQQYGSKYILLQYKEV